MTSALQTLPEAALELVDIKLVGDKTRRIIRAIGLSKTVSLLDRRGGTYIDLPHGPRRTSRLKVLPELIGEDAAGAFFDEFADGSKRILLPKADKILMQLRDAVICTELETYSVPTVTLRHGLHIRTVQLIRKRGPTVAAEQAEVIQMGLFEQTGSGSRT